MIEKEIYNLISFEAVELILKVNIRILTVTVWEFQYPLCVDFLCTRDPNKLHPPVIKKLYYFCPS